MSPTTTMAEAPRKRSQRPVSTPNRAPSRQATGHASTMLHTCQSGSVPNHHSCGATPIPLAATTRAPEKTSPARNGGIPVAGEGEGPAGLGAGCGRDGLDGDLGGTGESGGRDHAGQADVEGAEQRQRERDREPCLVADEDHVEPQHDEAESDPDHEDGLAGHPAGLDDGHRTVTGDAGRGHGKTAHRSLQVWSVGRRQEGVWTRCASGPSISR